jgi:tRNA A-37 threonylcarbamoyl transferase component Bud32
MINLDLKKAVDKAIEASPERRVFPLLFEDEPYFVKRKMSNGRNKFAKQNVAAAFWCEVYKIMTVNQYYPLAPEIVLLDDAYFVMRSVGKTMQGVAKEAPWESCRMHAFRKVGESLARLHECGLHHGRPALRDIAYDKETDKVTFLDWENEKQFVKADPRVLDLFLFVHSCFREKFSKKHRELIDEAMKGYVASPVGREIHRQAKALIHRLGTSFGLVHKLRVFGWTDVTSLDEAREYLLGLETE